MVRVYLDQNVLINCANYPHLHQGFMAANERGVRFVLSPWHFYEIGSIEPARGEELIGVVETLNPEWILDRSDLQVAEFLEAWGNFYGFASPTFRPIGTLAQVTSPLLHEPESVVAGLTLRDFVRIVHAQAEREIGPVLDRQREIAAANQVSVQGGLLTARMQGEIQLAFGALMLARSKETGPDAEKVRRDMESIRSDPFMRNLLIFFIKEGQYENLKAWQMESILTGLHHEGKKDLRRNRLLDRQHAVTSLSYCDRLVTDDKELHRLRDQVAARVIFQVGLIQTADQFLRSI